MNNAEHPVRALHGHDPPRPQPGHGPGRPAQAGVPVSDVTKMTIWGNHSATQYPDLFHAEVGGPQRRRAHRRPGLARVGLHPHRAEARAAIIEAAASPAPPRPPTRRSATCTHLGPRHARGRLGQHGHPRRTARTASPKASSRRSPSPPATASTRSSRGLELNDFSRERIDASVAELGEERRGRQARPHLSPASSVLAPDFGALAPKLGSQFARGLVAGYFRNLLVVLSASTLPPVWHVAQ